jgi:hypothetical protein
MTTSSRLASSTNSTGSTASAIRSSIASCPIGVIAMRPPAANEPSSSIRSMLFHSGQPGTSAQSRQICSGRALVSMLCSAVHIVASFCA